MLLAGTLGLVLTLILAWQVPRLFRTMPPELYPDVRISIILVGSSLAFGLVCSVYSAVFQGLQRYAIPMAISVVNRVSYAGIIIVVVALHGSLTAMGIAVAAVNVVTGCMQVVAWSKKAAHIRVSARLMSYSVLKGMARYCSLQSIWTLGMLCVTGLDVTIVGHYDYVQTAYYSIATLPTSFVLLVIAAMANPLMPASSAMSTRRSPAEMGDFLGRISRYTTVLLLLTALPLMVCGLPILSVWVGPVYAANTLQYLRLLVLANLIRNLCLPYATLITATGRQGAATATAVSEAVVNLGSSIYLASRFGAVGVAIGTLLGALVSVALHFLISMRYTQQTIAISRRRLLLKGIMQPGVMALPSLALLPLWWMAGRVELSGPVTALWAVSTLGLAWWAGLQASERAELCRRLNLRLVPVANSIH
jgi:O-antigen/teichoic acid export membrane protein